MSMQILLSMFNLHTVSTALTPRHGRGRPRGCLRTLRVRLRRICPPNQSFFGAWAARPVKALRACLLQHDILNRRPTQTCLANARRNLNKGERKRIPVCVCLRLNLPLRHRNFNRYLPHIRLVIGCCHLTALPASCKSTHNLQIVGRPKVSSAPIVPDWVFTAGAGFGRMLA